MAAAPHDWRSRQPGKAVWMPIAIADVLIRGSFLGVLFLLKFARPTSAWTWRQALCNEIFRTAFQHMTYTRLL